MRVSFSGGWQNLSETEGLGCRLIRVKATLAPVLRSELPKWGTLLVLYRQEEVQNRKSAPRVWNANYSHSPPQNYSFH
jgi:hypothetical protein